MKIKYILISLMCIIVMIISVILPSVLSKMQNQKLVGNVVLEPIESGPAVSKKQLGNAEKINLINSYGQQGKTVAMTMQPKYEGIPLEENETEFEIYQRCMSELDKLVQLSLLPGLEADVLKFIYTIETFMDVSDLSIYTVVWNVHISYKNVNIMFTIDEETYTIYDLSYTLNYEYSTYSFTEKTIKLDIRSLIQIWAEYFGFTIKEMVEKDGFFYVLFLDDTGVETIYQFELNDEFNSIYMMLGVGEQYRYIFE